MSVYIATHWSGKKQLSVLVTEEDKSIIETASDDIKLYMRDYHGYGDDHDLHPGEISFTVVPDAYAEAANNFFAPYVDNDGEYILDLITLIRNKKKAFNG